VNRGKMSLRDVIIKSSEMGYIQTAVISQMKANPSRIDFYDVEGEIGLSIDVTVGLPEKNSSRINIKSEDLKFYSEVKEIENLADILDIPVFIKGSEFKNLISIRYMDENNKALLEFYDEAGNLAGPKIYIKGWRT
jgi:U3 small nucleolar ribonucleoprotein protein IMP4